MTFNGLVAMVIGDDALLAEQGTQVCLGGATTHNFVPS